MLPWSDRVDFDVTANPDATTLSIIERPSGMVHQLGWWDQARWHPFALRWVELRALTQTWTNRSDVLPAPFPLLLLCRFVGFGVDQNEEHEDATRLVADSYRSLGFRPDDVSRLTEHSLPRPTEDDYRWTRSPNSGWFFGGRYACYSIRNREHRDGAEGTFPFPFSLIREVFADVP